MVLRAQRSGNTRHAGPQALPLGSEIEKAEHTSNIVEPLPSDLCWRRSGWE